MNQPYVWQMIRESIDELKGKATYSEIIEHIHSKYENVNERTIRAQIITCTVNQPSRIYYSPNNRERIADSESDFLFSTGRGRVVKYNIEEHGIWEIRKNELGNLKVKQVIDEDTNNENDEVENDEENYSFAYENHLRDFLERNLSVIDLDGETKLKLYYDENERSGIEYQTDIGRIDILAVDENKNFYVLELKVSKGSDKTVGQILRYLGWVKQNLAKNKNVTGIIIANKFDDKLKYAVSMVNNLKFYKYELNFDLSKVEF